MIKPIHDRVVLKKVNLEVKTASGLYLGEIEGEREVCYGQVVNCGTGKQVDGTGIIPLTVQPGDVVIFNDVIAKRVNYKGENLFLVRESDIYGIIDDKNITIADFVTEKMDTTKKAKMLG